jgi:hypothetical protein
MEKNLSPHPKTDSSGVALFLLLIESLWVHSPRLAACAVIPADAGIQKPDWMPDQVRHDAEYSAACGGVVYLKSLCGLGDLCGKNVFKILAL